MARFAMLRIRFATGALGSSGSLREGPAAVSNPCASGLQIGAYWESWIEKIAKLCKEQLSR